MLIYKRNKEWNMVVDFIILEIVRFKNDIFNLD
jgi:hypothetical protein